MTGYEYRKTLYKDYYQSQSGRTFQLNLEKKLEFDWTLIRNEIVPVLPSDKNINLLDIGCGYGSLLFHLKKIGYKNIKGIDLSEGQIKVAQSIGLEGIAELHDLIPYLQQHKENFDVITGLDIIEHFSKNELIEVLELVNQALKPGGIAIFRTPNLDAPFATQFANGDLTHENYMNASSAQQVLLNTGFSKAEVRSSHMETQGFVKETLRKLSWIFVHAVIKFVMFATARSSGSSIYTPNMLIIAKK